MSLLDIRRLQKWLKLEADKLNADIVVQRKSLAELDTAQEEPKCITRSGRDHYFRREHLQLLTQKLSYDEQQRLRLPITFYYDHRVSDSCYLTTELEAETLYRLGAIERGRKFINNKLWISRSIALELKLKYPDIIQIIIT